MVDLEIIESDPERGEDDIFNVGYVDGISVETIPTAPKNDEKPHIRIEKQGITTHSLTIEIIPSLLLAEQSLNNIKQW